MPRRFIAAATDALAALTKHLAALRQRSDAHRLENEDDGDNVAGVRANGSQARAIIDALPDAALLLDGALTLLHGNDRAREMFGSLAIGEHVARTSRHPELSAALAEAQKTG
jgi:PAS domain-containing protein